MREIETGDDKMTVLQDLTIIDVMTLFYGTVIFLCLAMACYSQAKFERSL
jgi:hypothetical protein